MMSLEICWWNFGDYPVDELSPQPSFDQPSQHHKNSLATEEKAKFHQFNSKIYIEPDYMYRAFSAICETRRLSKAGYARFRDFLLYGERGLAGKKALINIFQDTLALE